MDKVKEKKESSIKDKINIKTILFLSPILMLILVVLLLFVLALSPIALIGFIAYSTLNTINEIHRRIKIHQLNILKLEQDV